MAFAHEIRPGDQVLIPDIGCWARCGSVATYGNKALIAFKDAPYGTIGLILDKDSVVSAKRPRAADEYDPDTLAGVIVALRQSAQQCTPSQSSLESIAQDET